MSNAEQLAEALRLAREWFRYENAGEGPHSHDVIATMDAALEAHEAKAAQPVTADERVAFEAWFKCHGFAWQPVKDATWAAWQARAASPQAAPLTGEPAATFEEWLERNKKYTQPQDMDAWLAYAWDCGRASEYAQAKAEPLTDAELDALMPDPDVRGESWRDQWGYEKWDYLHSKEQVRQAMRAAIAATTKEKA